MSHLSSIWVSGWGTSAPAWNRVTSLLDPAPPIRHIPWWECLDPLGQPTALIEAIHETEEPIVLVGWSLGGLISLAAAAHCPERVASMILIGTPPRMTSEGTYTAASPRALRAMRLRLARDLDAALADFARLCIAPVEDPEFVMEYARQGAALDPEALAEGLAYLQQVDARDLLPQIQARVRVIHGEADQVVPVCCARVLAESIPGARLEELPGEGHAPALYRPATLGPNHYGIPE